MGTGKREFHTEKQLDYLKIFLIVVIIILAGFTVYLLYDFFAENYKDQSNELSNTQNDVKLNEEKENKEKTFDQMIQESGYALKEKVSDNLAYLEKDGKEFTIYSNGDIWTERITPWNGQSSKPAIDEAGNINIYTPEELKWVADQVISGAKNFAGVTITLRKDLDLGAVKNKDGNWEGNKWTPIVGFLDELPPKEGETPIIDDSQVPQDGSVNVTKENLKRFAGVFNGNGFSIRGINVDQNKRYQGLFGYNDGIITNLTISNSSIKGDNGIGAVAGLNSGTIQNCNIRDVEVQGNEKVGGIVGISMENSTIENSNSTDERADVIGNKYVGGIVGYLNNNNIIKTSFNKADVHGKEYVGGITGIAFYGTTIENASNYAKVIEGEKYVGGLAGYSAATIAHSKNYDKLNKNAVVEGNDYVGGLVGLNYQMGNISSSYNFGNIICKNDNCGGIAGLNNGNITNTYNHGGISAENPKAIRVGGICGQNLSQSFIYTSYNVGIIKANRAHGLVGANFGETNNCFYLDTSLKIDEENKENAKIESDMKENILTNLGPEFKKDEENLNQGYPVLVWQRAEV